MIIRSFGPFQQRLFVLCVLAWATMAAFWFTGLQFLLPAVKGKWGVQSKWQGVYASTFYTGMTVGGFIFGWMSDKYGRRPAFLACAWLATGFGALCAFAFDAWMLLLAAYGTLRPRQVLHSFILVNSNF